MTAHVKQREIKPWIGAPDTQALVVKASGDIDQNQIVVETGSADTLLATVAVAEPTSRGRLWVAHQNMQSGSRGEVVPIRVVSGVNTAGSAVGDPVYLIASGGWGLAPTVIGAPIVGYVRKVGTSDGVVVLEPGVALIGVDPSGGDPTDDEYFEYFTRFNEPAPITNQFVTDVHNDATVTKAGGAKLATVANSEAEAALLTWTAGTEVLLTQKPVLEAMLNWTPAGAAGTADERWAFGLISGLAAAEDALDNITTNLIFKVDGANLDLLWETDDGSVDDDDNDTGFNVTKGADFKVKIDCTDPTAPKFYVNDTLVGTAAMTPGALAVLPAVVLQRDAGDEVNSLLVKWIRFRATI